MQPNETAAGETIVGLTSAEVEERRARGEGETGAQSATKSVGAILRENICNLFNALNFAIAIILFAVGAVDGFSAADLAAAAALASPLIAVLMASMVGVSYRRGNPMPSHCMKTPARWGGRASVTSFRAIPTGAAW